MPDSFGVYDDLTVLEYLDFYATAHGVGPRGRRRLLDDLLTIVGLSDRRSSFVDVLSRGMKQRLGIARCLVHDPPILLLDEPASGLDPLARLEMQTLLRELSEMGKTVVISSHILPELGDVCTHAGIVHAGHLIVQGSVAELLGAAVPDRPLHVGLVDEASARSAAETLGSESNVGQIDVQGAELAVRVAGGPELDADLFVLLGQAGHRVLRFGRRPISLEDVYFAAVRSATEAA
jgi:ABC-2 type transport system ATP-binding protein